LFDHKNYIRDDAQPSFLLLICKLICS
jgi:hypothetical protein